MKETTLKNQGNSCYSIRLFLADNEPNSSRARTNLQMFIRERFGDGFSWEEIDVLETPAVALQENILVTPTLEIRRTGAASRILVFGSLDDTTILESVMPVVDTHEQLK